MMFTGEKKDFSWGCDPKKKKKKKHPISRDIVSSLVPTAANANHGTAGGGVAVTKTARS